MTTYQHSTSIPMKNPSVLPEETWKPPQKPAEAAEERLILGILEGRFPIDSPLPGERDLSALLGVTRPTLREALQRLARDGWVDIQQGKPTRVRNFWQEGSLGVLAALVQHPAHLPQDFVPQLLQVRQLLAPTYTRLAVERQPAQIARLAENGARLPDHPDAFADFDWQLHLALSRACGNPVFTLILNGFRELYPLMARLYFDLQAARQASRQFYTDLAFHARNVDGFEAEKLTAQVMHHSLQLWQSDTTALDEITPRQDRDA